MSPRRSHGLGYEDYRYVLWRHIMGRCYRPAQKDYRYYGARGITVWEPWHDAGTFCHEIIELLGDRPEGWTLDRRDNDGNYEPQNVRWADRRTQSRNQRHENKGRPSRLFTEVGARIGRGVVVETELRTTPTPGVPTGFRAARLRCDCGTEYVAALMHLVERNGKINTTSCGCAKWGRPKK